MSLPPGFLDELRDRLSIGQVVGRKVMWDTRKSNQGKGDLWAPCPFHQEKTASFHVDDRKGFYYCFGCHAKGDAISFVRETENVGFMEAIEILAGEAGMPMPERDPRSQEKADRRTQLVEVMEQSVRHYRMQLQTGAAGAARDYLAGRGLSDQALARWEIGFAPDARQGLFEALRAKGVDEALIVEAGLAARPDDGGAPYDRFRGRIVFPIRDGQGRAIALGGRAMDPEARAKYLNSPETPLFDKGRSLYNLKPAREAAGKGGVLIVAEGYMDAIALSEAGFGAVVAPLGTAITEDQLRMMWRVAPEPVIALDGDRAGLRAAERLVDLALPLLEAGKSLRFAIMPEGMDPDDLIRARGRGAVESVLAAAVPLVDMLWRRETAGRVFDSPERKAGLDHALRQATGQITDASLRHHYDAALKEMRWQFFRKPRAAWSPGTRRKGGWRAEPVPFGQAGEVTQGARASVHVAGPEGAEDGLREAVILAVLLAHPRLVLPFEAALERLEPRDADHRAVRDAVLRHAGADDLRAAVAGEIGAAPLEKIEGQRHVAIQPAIRRPDGELARMCLAEEFAKLQARRGHDREVAEAMEDILSAADERLTHRLSDGARALDRAARGDDDDDRAEYETGANGARMRRDERGAFDDLLGGIDFGKAGRRGQ